MHCNSNTISGGNEIKGKENSIKITLHSIWYTNSLINNLLQLKYNNVIYCKLLYNISHKPSKNI